MKFRPHPIQDGPESFNYPPFDAPSKNLWADPDFVRDEEETSD